MKKFEEKYQSLRKALSLCYRTSAIRTFILFSLVLGLFACSSAETLKNGNMSVEVPESFREFRATDLSAHYPDVDFEKARGFGTDAEDQIVCVYYQDGELDPSTVTPEMMAQLMKQSSENMSFSVAEIKSFAGINWYHLIYTDLGPAGPYRVEMFMGSKSGTLYGFSTRCSGEFYPHGNDTLNSLWKSIKVN